MSHLWRVKFLRRTPLPAGESTRRTARFALAVAVLSIAMSTRGMSQDDPSPRTWPTSYRQDANLFDVQFVNAKVGWAVGDRGTILHTGDGGETWTLQECPVRSRLEAVHFIDPLHGWVVGGSTTPYTHRSVGFVLRTDNGGQTWQLHDDQLVPWLTGVHFSDVKHGVAYGNPSAMFPSAVYRTQDAGMHWTPWQGASTGWVDAIIQSRGRGLLIDRTGQLVRLDQTALKPIGKLKRESRRPLRLASDGRAAWWMCGNQGLVMTSSDAGTSWQAPGELPIAPLLTEFDWQAIDALGDSIWMVGVPGSRVLVTHDGGKTWQLTETGHQLPLYAVEFADAQNGWAVGAMGCVLATHDGGRTWSYQRGERRHLAVLGIFGQAEQIPWEMIAQFSAAEGYWTRIEVLSGSPGLSSKTGQSPLSTRLHEATVMLGGVGANLIESLPAPDRRAKLPADLIHRRWDRITQSDSATQLTEYLVRQIRTWQPDLVVVARPDDGLDHLTRQIVLQATEQAADPSRFRSHLQAGLTPWRVSRVTTYSTDADSRGYPISSRQMIRSLGQSVGHLADRARATLMSDYRPGDERLSLRRMNGDSSAPHGLFGSKVTTSDDRSRRTDQQLAEDVRSRNRQSQRQINLDALLRDARHESDATWQHAMHLVPELSAEQQSELFMAGAAAHLRAGRSTVAFELLNRLQRDLIGQPLQEAARLQLFWYMASEEATIHWPLPTRMAVQKVAQVGELPTAPGQVRPATFTQPTGVLDPHQPATTPPQFEVGNHEVGDHEIESRHRFAQQLVESIQAQQPDLYFEPMLRFPLAAFQRRTGQLELATKFWRSQLAGRTDPSYRSWAASELALDQPEGIPARPTWLCPRLRQPPRLDGQLTDAVWQGIPATLLRSPGTHAGASGSASPATEVRLAYDSEFLYVAVQADAVAEWTGGQGQRDDEQTRRRDEVFDRDRIEIYLDVDRDAVTHWCLAIDHRGWASERLNDDYSWNPQWYIAAAKDASTWTFEAAIPLSELSQEAAESGATWCLGVQRIVPGQTWQTWLQPAPVEMRPDEFGLLRFQ